MAEKYLSAKEAIKESGIPGPTFYRLVKAGEIEKHLSSPTSKHGMYSSREIARIKRRYQRKSTPAEIGETDWIRGDDVGSMYNLEYQEYGDETGDPSIVRKWYERNPYICRVLYNKANRRDFWGTINMLPLEEETIFKLLKNEIKDIDLDPQKDILTFDKPGVYNFYVASVIVAPDKKQHFPMLINSLFDFWLEQSPDRTIGKIYGRLVSDGGEMMAKKLFFSPRWDISETAYMLDMKRPNPSKFIQSYQYALQQKGEEHVATM